MLLLDVDKRITAEEALSHPYVAKYHDETDEPIGKQFDDSFEQQDLTVQQWKGEPVTLCHFIGLFHHQYNIISYHYLPTFHY